MGTITITVGDPLPTFDSLYQAMLPNLSWPPVGLPGLPSLPGIPSMFPTMQMPNTAMVMMTGQLMVQQLLTSSFQMIKPIIEFLGLGMDLIPKIPVLNMSITDLLAASGDELVSKLQGLVPNIYFSINIPDVSVVQYLKQLTSSYLTALAGFLQGLIKQVTDKIKIPGMPTLPAIPTMDDVKQMLLSQIPPPINDLKNIDLNALISNISIPGIPFDFSLPVPFIPTFNIPEIDFNEMLANLYSSIVMMPMDTMKKFIMDKLSSVISLQLPTLVLVIPTIDITIPNLPIPQIPQLPEIPEIPAIKIPTP